MLNTSRKLHAFMKAACGDWRNAIYITCESCTQDVRQVCEGFLLSFDATGAPLVISAEAFKDFSGERPDANECIAVMSRDAFETAFSLRIAWQLDDSGKCALSSFLL